MSAFIAFVRERKEYICDWKGTQDGAGAADFFAAQASGNGSSASTAAATPAPVEEEKKVAAPTNPAPAKAAAGAKAPAEPTKRKQGMNKWIYENYTNETIVIDDPDVVNNRVSFTFFNMNKCNIKLVGKCQNISVQSCKGTTLETDMVVSQVELFKCQAFNLRAMK